MIHTIQIPPIEVVAKYFPEAPCPTCGVAGYTVGPSNGYVCPCCKVGKWSSPVELVRAVNGAIAKEQREQRRLDAKLPRVQGGFMDGLLGGPEEKKADPEWLHRNEDGTVADDSFDPSSIVG